MKNILLLSFTLFLMNSCKKQETQNQDSAEITQTDSKEVSLVQQPLKLANDKGEEITVTYFAEGDMVAVKIRKEGEEEQSLSAKTVNDKGNPVFANDKYIWESLPEERAGKIIDKDGNAVKYTEISN